MLPSMPLRHALALLLTLAGLVPASHAQLALPTVPALPGGLDAPLRPVLSEADRRLADLRQAQVRLLLRQHRDVLDTDPRGELIVRHEVLLLAPEPATLQRIEAAGYRVVRRLEVAPLGLEAVVLRPPADTRTWRALRRLQRLAPEAEFTFNHIYLGSGQPGEPLDPAMPGRVPADLSVAVPIRLGLIDSGIDAAHPALQGLHIERWGCGGREVPTKHGTAVASLLAGDAAGAPLSGTVLHAADIYCGAATGGAVLNLVQALAWMAEREVPVVNLSVVGPANPLLERAVSAMAGRGHLLVAAVGNDGPGAPPLFPAAYPPVVGVTAVDHRQRVLPEALRGPQVHFAAPGTLLAAGMGAAREAVRGTSFASPIVARLAATRWRPGDSPGSVLARLEAEAQDLGAAGPDPSYGRGLLGADLPLVSPRK